MQQCEDDNVSILSIRVPSLKHLFLYRHLIVGNDGDGFVIDTPSVEHLKIVDYSYGSRVVKNTMSRIITASINIFSPQTKQLLGSLTSAKRLLFCLPTSKVTMLFSTHYSFSLLEGLNEQ